MNDSKMQRMSAGMECVYTHENPPIRVYLSPVRVEKKVRKETLSEKIIVMALKLFYSLTVTYFVGKWAIAFAYMERGYKAYGGEYFLIAFTFAICYWVVSRFFENFRR